jgi:catechol 2,3-dioxygenase-like lactoylglutathione lyase family enzyme
MFEIKNAFSGFAVPDIQAAREFYADKLGLEVSEEMDGYILNVRTGDRDTMIYAKPDHQPANCTILNFAVEDVEAAVDALSAKGVTFERYDGFDQDEKGIARGEGPDIAWFKDPGGNILSVLQD